MDQAKWLNHLLRACRRALARMRDQGVNGDRELLADLERYCARIEGELREARRRSVKPS